jgi:glycerate dehydrogenase
MGIIGYGAIGQAVGKKAEAFGMEVLAYSPVMTKEQESEHCHMASVDEILEKSDVIALHCPLTAENAQMINKDTIAKMKDGVVILNTSRGGLIHEEDLRDALNSGYLAAAGLDVVSTEPIREDNVLFQANNVYITPHIAWAPREARNRLMGMAVDNVRAFLAGIPINQVH